MFLSLRGSAFYLLIYIGKILFRRATKETTSRKDVASIRKPQLPTSSFLCLMSKQFVCIYNCVNKLDISSRTHRLYRQRHNFIEFPNTICMWGKIKRCIMYLYVGLFQVGNEMQFWKTIK